MGCREWDLTVSNRRDIEEFYADLTEYINDNSGLDELSVDQVKWVYRTNRDIEKGKLSLNGENPRNQQPTERTIWDQKQGKRCNARKGNGNPCRKFAIIGSTVCREHGGAAKQVVNAARIRLRNAAELMAKELLKMATDDNISDATKLKAITEALDRGGVSAKTEIELTAKPYETVFEAMETGGSRSEYRKSHSIQDNSDDTQPTALVDNIRELPRHNDDEPIDAEVLDAGNDYLIETVPSDQGQPITPDNDESRSPFDSAPAWPDSEPPQTPGTALMTLDDAVAAQAAVRRSIAALRSERR